MTRWHFDFPAGATPLDPDEMRGLIPSDIVTQEQLNQAEQHNIIQARLWATAKKRLNVLTESFLQQLHKRMFNEVWKWAGVYRKSDKNIGVSWFAIPTEIQKLLADASYWIQHGTYTWDEIGARFHHRLVSIHAFANGNGRHARLVTDLLLQHNGEAPFTWGAIKWSGDLATVGVARARYIQALRDADQRNFQPLIVFVRL